MAKMSLTKDKIPSQRGVAKTNEATDWRPALLARLRTLIQDADPDVVEERKWKKPTNPAGVPVWSHSGIICTGETYQNAVKLTFFKGAALPDPTGLFNSSLDGGTRRAIDFHQDDKINEKALKALIRAAVAMNTAPLNTSKTAAARPARAKKKPAKPKRA